MTLNDDLTVAAGSLWGTCLLPCCLVGSLTPISESLGGHVTGVRSCGWYRLSHSRWRNRRLACTRQGKTRQDRTRQHIHHVHHIHHIHHTHTHAHIHTHTHTHTWPRIHHGRQAHGRQGAPPPRVPPHRDKGHVDAPCSPQRARPRHVSWTGMTTTMPRVSRQPATRPRCPRPRPRHTSRRPPDPQSPPCTSETRPPRSPRPSPRGPCRPTSRPRTR